MTILETTEPESLQTPTLTAAIFDVDGVLLASPHERAWREALKGFADPARFTTAMYQAHVAGKPRLSGALAALEALGVPDAERQAVAYAERKQKRLEELIHAGSVAAFPDALRFVQAVGGAGLAYGGRIVLEERQPNDAADPPRLRPKPARRLQLPMSAVAICGRASRTRRFSCSPPRNCSVAPAHCFVVEDAPAGIEAARAGGMTALGVARLQRRGRCCGRQERIWW